MKYGIILCLTLPLLSACGSSRTQQQQDLMEDLARRPMSCRMGADCDQKWNRAIKWVTKHSEMGMKTVSDNLIEANMVAAEGTKPVLKYPEFSVVRYRRGDSYVMSFSAYCDEGFKCNPSGLQLRASFVTFVMGPPPGVIVEDDTATRKFE